MLTDSINVFDTVLWFSPYTLACMFFVKGIKAKKEKNAAKLNEK